MELDNDLCVYANTVSSKSTGLKHDFVYAYVLFRMKLLPGS